MKLSSVPNNPFKFLLNYLQNNSPKVFFFCYLFTIVLAMLLFQPGWGFMDDVGNIEICKNFWSGKTNYFDLMSEEMKGGRFRPLYYLWIFLAYTTQIPVLIYIFVVIVGFITLIIWGKMFTEIFPNLKGDLFTIYVFPLMFFVVISFWHIFMFISIQEKFVYIFSTFAFYFLIKAYQNNNLKELFKVFGFILLMLAGKETGISIVLTFLIFSVLDLIFFRVSFRVSSCLAMICTLIFFLYFIFISKIIGAYSAPYKTEMNLSFIVGNFQRLDLIVCMIIVGVFIVFKDFFKREVKSYYLLFPLSVISYILVLSPWRPFIYLFSPMTPFIVGAFFILFYFAYRSNKLVGAFLKGAIVVITLVNLFTVIIPFIEKMGDKPKIVEIIKKIISFAPNSIFFYPPPMIETASLLRSYTKASINYIDVINTRDLKSCNDSCFLVVNDESGPIKLEQSISKKLFYANSTWSIFILTSKSS